MVSVQQRAETRRGYRPDIEGLRGIAIGLVLLSHFAIPGFEGGFVGVDVFFVVSGFVITSMLLRHSEEHRISVSDFFARRARRILPAAVVVIIVSMAIERIAYGHAVAAALVRPARLILLFVFNWDGASVVRLTLTGNPILAYWSLSVEEQFYLAFPLILFGLSRVGKRWPWRRKVEVAIGVVTLASFLWAVHSPAVLDTSVYVGTLTRAWQIGVGCLLAFEASRLARLPKWVGAVMAWTGLALAIIAGTTTNLSAGYPRWSALVPVVGAALVIAGGTTAVTWGAESILGAASMRAIGRWSYGIYLWQIPVLLLISRWWGAPRTLPIDGRAAGMIVTTAVAAASFGLLESPIRHWPLLAKRPALTLQLAGGAIILALITVTLMGM